MEFVGIFFFCDLCVSYGSTGTIFLCLLYVIPSRCLNDRAFAYRVIAQAMSFSTVASPKPTNSRAGCTASSANVEAHNLFFIEAHNNLFVEAHKINVCRGS